MHSPSSLECIASQFLDTVHLYFRNIGMDSTPYNVESFLLQPLAYILDCLATDEDTTKKLVSLRLQDLDTNYLDYNVTQNLLIQIIQKAQQLYQVEIIGQPMEQLKHKEYQ